MKIGSVVVVSVEGVVVVVAVAVAVAVVVGAVAAGAMAIFVAALAKSASASAVMVAVSLEESLRGWHRRASASPVVVVAVLLVEFRLAMDPGPREAPLKAHAAGYRPLAAPQC